MKETTKKIIDEYINESEVVMGEFLAQKEVPQGMTFEEAFETYIECMEQANGDRFFAIKEGETIIL